MCVSKQIQICGFFLLVERVDTHFFPYKKVIRNNKVRIYFKL